MLKLDITQNYSQNIDNFTKAELYDSELEKLGNENNEYFPCYAACRIGLPMGTRVNSLKKPDWNKFSQKLNNDNLFNFLLYINKATGNVDEFNKDYLDVLISNEKGIKRILDDYSSKGMSTSGNLHSKATYLNSSYNNNRNYLSFMDDCLKGYYLNSYLILTNKNFYCNNFFILDSTNNVLLCALTIKSKYLKYYRLCLLTGNIPDSRIFSMFINEDLMDKKNGYYKYIRKAVKEHLIPKCEQNNIQIFNVPDIESIIYNKVELPKAKSISEMKEMLYDISVEFLKHEKIDRYVKDNTNYILELV